MAEYIERTEELMLAMNAGARAIENTKRYHGAVYIADLFSDNPQEIPYLQAAKVLREVSDAPAADVEPVRRGRWEGYTHSRYCGIDEYGDPIYRDGTVYYCSNPKCRRKTAVKENFCPSCGAKMDLEDNDES